MIGDHVRGSTLGTTLFGVCFCRPNSIPGAECSAVGSAPGLGPGGREFESHHSDGQYCLSLRMQHLVPRRPPGLPGFIPDSVMAARQVLALSD
nr:MAG TPA: hypothetical protein [Caudoviricetes sp.]